MKTTLFLLAAILFLSCGDVVNPEPNDGSDINGNWLMLPKYTPFTIKTLDSGIQWSQDFIEGVYEGRSKFKGWDVTVGFNANSTRWDTIYITVKGDSLDYVRCAKTKFYEPFDGISYDTVRLKAIRSK